MTANLAKNPFLIASHNVANPIWVSVSEAAKISGVNSKTIRRALQNQVIKYKIVKNRYSVDFSSLLQFLYAKKKLRNKLSQYGIGQYVDKWRE
jgi:hypothetical protein